MNAYEPASDRLFDRMVWVLKEASVVNHDPAKVASIAYDLLCEVQEYEHHSDKTYTRKCFIDVRASPELHSKRPEFSVTFYRLGNSFRSEDLSVDFEPRRRKWVESLAERIVKGDTALPLRAATIKWFPETNEVAVASLGDPSGMGWSATYFGTPPRRLDASAGVWHSLEPVRKRVKELEAKAE